MIRLWRRWPWLPALAAVALLTTGCLPTFVGQIASAPKTDVRFRDVTRAVGIDFVHRKPTFDQKVSNIMPWLTSVGASVAAVDFDNNGCVDLYVTNSGEGSQNALYKNDCNGRFVDVAPELGLADVNQDGVSVASAWADYNNSGCQSLYLLKWGRSELFRNNCDGTFTRVTDEAGVGYWGYPVKATWADFNRDGCLDIYVGVYFRPEHNLWNLDTTRIMHNDFERARNAGRNLLYQSNCDGTFTEVAAALGVDDPGWTLATAAVDLNGDGWPDLFNANDFGPDGLFLNEQGKGFRRVVQRTGIGDDTHKGMNVDFGDVFNDGRMALYISNISKPRYILEGNALWVQEPNGEWRDRAPELKVANCGFSWGATFVDVDNSGRLDIFVMNGFFDGNRKQDWWYELGTLATTPGVVIEDAANWPPIGDKSLSAGEAKCLFLQAEDGTFTDVAKAAGVDATYIGRGVAAVDLFNRGLLDLVLANQGDPLQVFRNETDNGNGWLKLKLVGRPPSNRDAIGARVKVVFGDKSIELERGGGSSHGGQNDPRLHVGLGSAAKADRIEIRWPSGRFQVLTDVAAGQILVVEEPDTPVPPLK